MTERVVLIEFNELNQSLLDGFMADGSAPNFLRLYEQSQIFVTDASEDEYLEPWIQWPTLHSGTTYGDHGVFRLGEGQKLRGHGIAAELRRAGIPVGLMASMNTGANDVLGYLVPDPWNPHDRPEPAELADFFDFVAQGVQNSSLDGGPALKSARRFIWFLLRNGVQPESVWRTARQLIDERLDSSLSWRRASVLERVQYDVFRSLNKKYEVRFASFFCNSVAHYQHYYWRNMDPERFSNPPPADADPSLAGAIRFGYRALDTLIGRFLDDFSDDRLVLATALSQEPWDTDKCTYRPLDFDSFLRLCDLPSERFRIEPVMAEQFNVVPQDPSDLDEAVRKLEALRVGDRGLMEVQAEADQVFTGCALLSMGDIDRKITTPGGALVPVADHFHMIHSVRSGRHNPRACSGCAPAATNGTRHRAR